MWGLGTLPEGENNAKQWPPSQRTYSNECFAHLFLSTGFPAAAYAAYAAGRGYSGYPSFGLPYPTGKFVFIHVRCGPKSIFINT